MDKSFPKEIRGSLMISKAELAGKAHTLPTTFTRVEQGKTGSVQTRPEIIPASGLKKSEKNKWVGENMEWLAKNRPDRRSGMDRRKFIYDIHIPENRSGKERRKEQFSNKK
jgi:hypothetical protein